MHTFNEDEYSTNQYSTNKFMTENRMTQFIGEQDREAPLEMELEFEEEGEEDKPEHLVPDAIELNEIHQDQLYEENEQQQEQNDLEDPFEIR